MKRLFRTSKTGMIDPLPPPNDPKSTGDSHLHGHHSNRPRQGSVTPFPIDAGRDATPSGQPGRRREKPSSGSAPTRLEIQQMQAQAEAAEKDHRRDQWLQSQHPSDQTILPPKPPRVHEGSPDGWSMISGQLPGQTNAEFSNGSTPTIQAPLLLPPGARPPSPQIRPKSPFDDPYSIGRDRGYSSASGSHRESDHDSSTGHYKSSNGHQMPIPKPAQPVGTRSPLHHSYATPPESLYPDYNPLADGVSAIRIEGPSPEVEAPREGRKKFWGMNWGEKNKKNLDKPIDEPRKSSDRTEERTASSHGHVSTEDEHRGRSLGLSIGGFMKDNHAPQVDNVTAAIQILCAHPDPPFASVYEVCDRINHSSSPESVGKEAAHALRKQFKHGSESERRSAANLWLLMMRNVPGKGFRSSATGKKFMSVLEPILLAPPGKSVVSAQTHRMIADILADLTYHFGGEKGSEPLGELWRKVKLPQESDIGLPLPSGSQAFTPDNFMSLDSAPTSQINSSTNHLGIYDRPARGHSPLHGPGYHNLPNHSDDVRRLVEECTAAQEAARVLAEALVYTRPDELDGKPVIREFYRKCFLAHESLTNQIDWAQAEAAQSRERMNFMGMDETPGMTMEEQALGTLFEAHSALAEALKQHDDLERLAVDEQEFRQVRERSKKDTRMDRNQGEITKNRLAPGNAAGSSSRSPSPVPHARLPSSPPQNAFPMPRPITSNTRSRTPSPDHLPRISASPARASSPLGHSLAKARGPRPLPNPFSRGQNASSQSLSSGLREGGTEPSRSGTGSTVDHSQPVDAEDDNPPPIRPSRKALGKRRVIEDPDNHFDPNDIFGGPAKKDPSESSEESVTADEVFFAKPVKYAYDAYQEKLDSEIADQRSRANSRASAGYREGGSSHMSSRPIEAR